jgi:LmbE family N-acetylglucosaminyl deacetylase
MSLLRRTARRLIVAALFGVLHGRARPLSLPAPGSAVLVIAPHPDDESLGCGRFIAACGDAGVRVHLVWMTDGEASHPVADPAALGRRRRAEAIAAAALLGVPAERCHHFAGPDGRLSALTPDERERLISGLARLVADLRPAEVFVTTAFDGSTEHRATHAFATEALARLPEAPPLRTYLVWAHWNVRALARACLGARSVWWRSDPARNARRRAALAAHATQLQPLPPATQPLLSPHFLACFPANGEFYLDR